MFSRDCCGVHWVSGGNAGAANLSSSRRSWSRPTTLDRPPTIRWLRRVRYSTLEKPAHAGVGMEVVRYDMASGKRSVAIPATSLMPPGATAPLSVTDHQWSPTATWCC